MEIMSKIHADGILKFREDGNTHSLINMTWYGNQAPVVKVNCGVTGNTGVPRSLCREMLFAAKQYWEGARNLAAAEGLYKYADPHSQCIRPNWEAIFQDPVKYHDCEIWGSWQKSSCPSSSKPGQSLFRLSYA